MEQRLALFPSDKCQEGPHDRYKLDDLFSHGSESSPRKAGLFLAKDDSIVSSVFSDFSASGCSSSSLQCASPRCLDFSSPGLTRMGSKDGLTEGPRQTIPVVRHTKSLALRRVSSLVHDSQQLQKLGCMHDTSPYSFESKFSPLQANTWEDRMSESSSSESESVPMETDHEGSSHEDSPKSMDNDARSECQGDGTDVQYPTTNLMSSAEPIPCRPVLQRQDTVLFEHIPSLIFGTQWAGSSTEQQHKEFNLGKRWNVRKLQNLSVQPSFEEQKPAAQRSQPMQMLESHPEEQRIKGAVENLCRRGSQVIADGTEPYALPCFRGRKEELMFISCDTLAEVLEGMYDHVLDHFEIIDCRYPYEYEGGHITGALNMYKAENIGEIMSWKNSSNGGQGGASDVRMALIFHCEFSSQRGPAMMRLLRDTDRKHNAHCYPNLCHPEIYLLEGGYKSFYEKYPHLCHPSAYVPMAHPDHAADLKKMLARSTSWHGKNTRTSKHSYTLVM